MVGEDGVLGVAILQEKSPDGMSGVRCHGAGDDRDGRTSRECRLLDGHVDAQTDLARASGHQGFLEIGAGRIGRHDVDGRGVFLAKDLDARVPDRHRCAQGRGY